MPKKRGQFSFSKKISATTSKGYMAAALRQQKKNLKPPLLAGAGIKVKRYG
jgi:hypothetical protein